MPVWAKKPAVDAAKPEVTRPVKSGKVGKKQEPIADSQPLILLAEDNETNQLLVKTLLKQWQMQVIVAENGKKALELIQQKPFKLVLMDVHMPEMDGYTATRAIRKLKGAAAELPIIAMTASALQGEAEKCLQAGMDDYISKPFNKDDFRQKLDQHLNRYAVS